MPNKLAALVPVLYCGLALSGCGLFHRAPHPPPVLILQPPIIFPAPPDTPMPPPTSYAVMDAPPDFSFAVILGPVPRPAPRRAPDVVAEAPAAPPESTPAPPLTPALTPQQQMTVRNQALAALERARNDLRLLASRRLSGSAAATRAQAGEYVRQAEQALQEGDAMRAQTLAAKAETLARFLLGQ